MELEVDPVLFNIIRHRLWMIVEEMGITLKRTSISPVIWEVNDFQTSILLPDASISAVGPYIMSQVACHHFIGRAIIERCSENPGFSEGDQFIMNDPYLGAGPHQPDVAIVAPVFSGNELVAWVATSAHQLDIGQSTASSGVTSIREVYQEGLRLSPVKLVEGGVLRQDIFDAIINMVRIPSIAIDLRAQMAANNVAIERLHSLVERYGLDVVTRTMKSLITFSKEKFQERLQELPDGTFSHVDYIDHDGQSDAVYNIDLVMEKRGSNIKFDLSKSSSQAPGIVNCAIGGTWGGIFSAIAPRLCYDIPWNQGLLEAVDLVAPEGTIVNALPPAPVSGASGEAVYSIRNAVHVCISKMLTFSTGYGGEVSGAWCGSIAGMATMGLNQYGERYVFPLMDHCAGGCGATSERDGMGTAGITSSLTLGIPNVETQEEFHPILFLFRQEAQDTGGPGRTRGGLSLEEAVIPYGTEDIHFQLKSHGSEIPNAVGVLGGYPGSTAQYTIIRDADVTGMLGSRKLPFSLEDIHGTDERLPPKVYGRVGKEDVIYYYVQGGGGCGDPLERSPDDVARDVAGGKVSTDIALRVYGVSLGSGAKPDLAESEKLRNGIRKKRLTGE